jgi:hypothetical protein
VTETEIREQRSSGPRTEGEKICHIVERDDPDRGLCGKDVHGLPVEPALADVRRPVRAGP